MTRKYLFDDTPVVIYKLIDPRNDKVRYVGWCKNVRQRYNEHLSEARRGFIGHKNNWIRSLLKEELKPIVEIIENILYKNKTEREQYWIKFYGRDNLTNGTDGGEGALGWVPSIEQRQKMSDVLKGRPGTLLGVPMKEETKRKLSESKKGKPAWNKGMIMSEEFCKKVSEGSIGKVYPKRGPMSDENKQKLSKSKKENMTDEIRQHISESKKGKTSPGKGKKHSGGSSSSIYIGVNWNKKKERWFARICDPNGKRVHIGSFMNQTEAALAYNDFALEYYGYKAILNQIPQSEIDSLWSNCTDPTNELP
jgi:hypothetical protein